MAGLYHYELIVKPGKNDERELYVYVTDHAGTEIKVERASGIATILGKSQTKVTLRPVGDRLQGTGKFKVDSKLKIAVSVSFPGEAPNEAQFTPFAPRKPSTAGDKSKPAKPTP